MKRELHISDDTYRFSRRVDNYMQYRPRYPQAIVNLLQTECDLTDAHVVADIGSGTGILSELFLKNGNAVFGIEPDPDMRAGGEHYLRAYLRFTSIDASAEATTLADHSVDFVTAAQAFHWFNHTQTKKEFARILVQRGWAVVVWNVHRITETPFLIALEKFWQKDFTGQRTQPLESNSAAFRRARPEYLTTFFAPHGFKEQVFDNPLVCDWNGLKGRVLSNRLALEGEDPRFKIMLDELKAIFEAHQVDGTVTIEQDTYVFYGQLLVE